MTAGPTTPFLTGVNVPEPRLAAIIAASRLPMRCIDGDTISRDPTAAGTVLCLVGSGPDMAAPVLWTRPVIGWIEVGTLDDAALGTMLRRAAGAACFVSLTSATAHEVPLSAAATAVLAKTSGLSSEALSDVEVALHEAVSNGLIHGNLQVSGMNALDVGALDTFSEVLADRLNRPEYARRRLEILCRLAERALTVEVIDEGPGYQPSPRQPGGPSGRGLAMIATVADDYKVLDGGRRICMRFAR